MKQHTPGEQEKGGGGGGLVKHRTRSWSFFCFFFTLEFFELEKEKKGIFLPNYVFLYPLFKVSNSLGK